MEKICLVLNESKGIINKNIYGHFSEHIGGVFYGGLWVGEDSPIPNIRGFRKSIVEKFKAIKPPVLRWPGGCFAETYDWRDGIGPRDKRPTTLNWWYRNDKHLESNQVGTNEFADFCRLVGAEPYFAANITSTTPLEIRNWMDYCNMPSNTTTLSQMRGADPLDVKYWGIGNENWGGGGKMTPEMYARRYIQYATVCESANVNDAKFIACGANSFDIDWTNRFMAEYNNRTSLYGLAFHYYCGCAGNPITFIEEEWYKLIEKAAIMDSLIERHSAAMRTYDPDGKIKIIVDEWGCWHPNGSGPSKGYNLFEQQSTIRDGMVAALTLNIFNNHCDTVAMANIAQICNCLHSLFLAFGDNMIVTPTYYVYDLFKGHQDAHQIRTVGSSDKLSVSASVGSDGVTRLTVCNLDYSKATELELSAFGGTLGSKVKVTTLANDDPHAHNTFEAPDTVQLTQNESGLTVQLKAASVNLIEIGVD